MQRKMRAWNLSSLATNTAGQLDVLGHNGDTLGMDGAQVGVLKQTNKVGLGRLLKSHDGRGLESQVSLEVLGNFTDQTLEGGAFGSTAQCSSGNDGSHEGQRYRACTYVASLHHL